MPNLKFIYIPQEDFDKFSERVKELYKESSEDIVCDEVKCYFLHHCSIVKKLGINLYIYLSNSLQESEVVLNLEEGDILVEG